MRFTFIGTLVLSFVHFPFMKGFMQRTFMQAALRFTVRFRLVKFEVFRLKFMKSHFAFCLGTTDVMHGILPVKRCMENRNAGWSEQLQCPRKSGNRKISAKAYSV